MSCAREALWGPVDVDALWLESDAFLYSPTKHIPTDGYDDLHIQYLEHRVAATKPERVSWGKTEWMSHALRLEDEIAELKERTSKQEQEITRLNEQVASQNREIAELKQQVAELKKLLHPPR